jgi:hypothetical protein
MARLVLSEQIEQRWEKSMLTASRMKSHLPSRVGWMWSHSVSGIPRSTRKPVAFWRTIRNQHPRQRISFLVGPPTYLSPTCADEVIAHNKVAEDWVQRLRLLAVA